MPKLLRITTTPLSLRSLLSNQMRYMKEKGFEVIMVSSEGKEWPDLLRNERCAHRIIPMKRNIAPLKDLRSLWRLYRLMKKEKPDIVHSHTPKAGLLAMIAARLAGVKIRIHTVAGLRFMTATGMFRRILVLMEKLTGRAATHVWPNSYSLLEYIRAHKLVSEKKLAVIGHGSSNGVDLTRFSVSALKEGKLREIKELIGFDETRVYLLSMGRIVKDKGINELSACFAKLHVLKPELRLLVLGHFEERLDPISPAAKEIIMRHPAVIHIDWNENVEYFMHIARLMVHPSYREGFPNTLLQAGAMGCPILCSAIEGNVDLVKDQDTGILFSPRSEEDLFEKLNYALGAEDKMKICAGHLKKKVENEFSQAYLHGCLEKKYRELLGQAA